jgi:hypothetical protein
MPGINVAQQQTFVEHVALGHDLPRAGRLASRRGPEADTAFYFFHQSALDRMSDVPGPGF